MLQIDTQTTQQLKINLHYQHIMNCYLLLYLF